MENYPKYIAEIVTIVVAIGGTWVAVKTLLARHDEKLYRIEKDIDELKDERKEIHNDLKNLTQLMNKIYAKVGVLDERTK